MPAVDTTHQDFQDADRGFLGTISPCIITNEAGETVWDGDSFSFVSGDSPDSVHPSLWRQSMLVNKHGLYEVTEGIYQVRGFDLSNITFVESDTGIIVIDPLISTETAAAALDLYRQHRGNRKVAAVIYTHSHVDHFGGVLGVTSLQDVERGDVQIIAPTGFMEHAVSENIYAGTAMSRRAGYMYGAALPRTPRGSVGAGLGHTTSIGQVGIIPPTVLVTSTGERLSIDGVDIEFQMTPDSEAPAEMHFYFPGFRALCLAENATHTLHNILTLRGALVRDARAWASYLTETIERYADITDVAFASHHWPTWDGDRVNDFISRQRDVYAYLHDETLRYINLGYQGAEIAEMIQLPPALEEEWSTRGYYGSINHNVKAIYQRYMGWFDANPVNLWPHPPQQQATRYVSALGGVGRVLELAAEAQADNDPRWAATLLGHAIFADPQNADVSNALANVLEQLGFSVENATWRNFYLAGALELREGRFGTPNSADTKSLAQHVSVSQVLDSLAIAIEAPKVWDLAAEIDLVITDLSVTHRLRLRHGVLIHRLLAESSTPAHTVIRLSKTRLMMLLSGDAASPGLEISGPTGALKEMLAAASPGDPNFAIVTP